MASLRAAPSGAFLRPFCRPATLSYSASLVSLPAPSCEHLVTYILPKNVTTPLLQTGGSLAKRGCSLAAVRPQALA